MNHIFSRNIDPEFEAIGNRRRMIGVRVVIRDGDEVIYDRTHPNYSAAEQAADAFMYDLLDSLTPVAQAA